ncbi:MAG: 30S ribosomal protein S30e [Candidatus Bathyarchaeota archaeon]|nr:MAG: 30S ribosomal protein S30e [Candidatus Bathyarchaeota archaeon]
MPTHGSLSKAGKVRSQTPKIATTQRKTRMPRIRSRRNYEKRVILQRTPGQNPLKRRRRRR